MNTFLRKPPTAWDICVWAVIVLLIVILASQKAPKVSNINQAAYLLHLQMRAKGK